MAHKGFFNAFNDVWMLDGVRPPMVDYCGALGHISPTDLGINAARAATLGLAHEAVATEELDAKVSEVVEALLQGGPKSQAAAKDLIRAVVRAVSVPVTPKTRLGWDDNSLNATFTD